MPTCQHACMVVEWYASVPVCLLQHLGQVFCLSSWKAVKRKTVNISVCRFSLFGCKVVCRVVCLFICLYACLFVCLCLCVAV